MLSIMMVAVHTLITLYAIVYHDKKDPEYLVGCEDGFCGILACCASFVATDEPIKAKSDGIRRRIFSRILTLGLQIPILVVTCSALHVIASPTAWVSQKTSVFVFVTVLMLHLTNAFENIFEGFVAIFHL